MYVHMYVRVYVLHCRAVDTYKENEAQFQTSSMRACQGTRSVYISVRNGNTGRTQKHTYICTNICKLKLQQVSVF